MKQTMPELTQDVMAQMLKLKAGRGWDLLTRYTHLPLSSRVESTKIKGIYRHVVDKAETGSLFAFLGNAGVGKTQLATDVMVTYARYLRSSEYTSAMRFFLEIKTTYRKESDVTELDVIKSFCKPQLLVIDEFEKRAETPWANALLFELVNNRYSMMKDTILMSNMLEKDFARLVGPGIASRMQETGGAIVLDWKSFRV